MGLYGNKNAIDIAAISQAMQPVVDSWQNGVIDIVDPNIAGGSYDKWTNKKTGQEHELLWSGQARIQPLRWPVLVSGQAEQVAYRSVRFQIPLKAEFPDDMLVREGLRIRVTNGGQFKDLERGLFVIVSGVNSSFAWNRTIETTMDTGIDLGPYEPPAPDPEPEP